MRRVRRRDRVHEGRSCHVAAFVLAAFVGALDLVRTRQMLSGLLPLDQWHCNFTGAQRVVLFTGPLVAVAVDVARGVLLVAPKLRLRQRKGISHHVDALLPTIPEPRGGLERAQNIALLVFVVARGARRADLEAGFVFVTALLGR